MNIQRYTATCNGSYISYVGYCSSYTKLLLGTLLVGKGMPKGTSLC